VSPFAKACPSCGAPDPVVPLGVKTAEKIGVVLTVCVTVPVIIVVVFGLCAGS
jgi:hypothetical protein